MIVQWRVILKLTIARGKVNRGPFVCHLVDDHTAIAQSLRRHVDGGIALGKDKSTAISNTREPVRYILSPLLFNYSTLQRIQNV